MEPQISKEPALHLPQPMPEQALWQTPIQAGPEQAPARELASAAPHVSAVPLTPVPVSTPASAQAGPHAASAAAPMPAQAVPTNEDEMNRLMVDKAKRIIAQTHTDPFHESEELGKLKIERINQIKGMKAAEG